MAEYERVTAIGVREVLSLAEEILPERIPLETTARDRNSITMKGRDGTVTIRAHRTGFETVVHAETDQVRTSRIDIETQYLLNKLPYQPGDQPQR